MSAQPTLDTLTTPALLSDSSDGHQVSCSDLSAATSLTRFASASSQSVLGGSSSSDGGDETDRDDDDEASTILAGADFHIPQRFTKSGRKRAVPFALKLMKVLSTKEFADVIGWLPSGKAFVVHKPKVFAATILPEYFKSAKYSSFTRKLHRWGFVRQYRGEETGAFYHDDFQRDRLDLVEKMSCYKFNDAPKASKPGRVPKPFKKVSLSATFSKKYRGDVQVQPAVSTAAPRTTQLTGVPPSIRQTNLFGESDRLLNERRVIDLSINNSQAFNPDLLLALQRQSMLDANPVWNSTVEMEVNRRLNLRLNAETTFHNLLRQQTTPFLPQGPLGPAPRMPGASWNVNHPLDHLTASHTMYGSLFNKPSLLAEQYDTARLPSTFQSLASIPNTRGSKTA